MIGAFAMAAGTALDPGVLSAQQAPATVSTISAPKVFEVVARRFEFVPSQIDVEEGDRVRLVIKSGDGVHGIGIKKFKVSKLVPRGGNGVVIEFVASAAGSFPIVCSESCGDGHEVMAGTLVVHVKPD